jgi:hydroxyacylglutathione hydrolase
VRIETLVVGPFGVNCYVVSERSGGPAMVVDPGFEPARILAAVRRAQLDVALIVNTHGHGDHIGANAAIKAAFPKAQTVIHADDAPMLADPALNLSLLFGYSSRAPAADRLVGDGDTLALGGLTFAVIHVPGHTAGGIALGWRPPRPAAPQAGADPDRTDPPVLFTGDTLFAGAIGRTDFPDGDQERLLAAIRRRLLAWPDETLVYAGHGPATTIAVERLENPFLS